MSMLNKRSTRKRTAVTYVLSSASSESDEDDQSIPKKKSKKMGCTGSKHEKLDLSDSSYSSTTTASKSTNRKPSSKLKESQSSASKQAKSKQSKATKPAKNVAAKTKATVPASTGINGIQNDGDPFDGNKMTIQRSVTPTSKHPQQQMTDRTKSTQSTSTTRKTGWTDEQLLSQLQYLDFDISSNIVRLFDEGNTIPFMCRYRRELIGNLDADKMREIKITYNHIKNIRSRAEIIIKDLEKRELLDAKIEEEICSAKSLDALDHLYAPFKLASKSSLFERAKAAGLEVPAEKLLHEPRCSLNFAQFVKHDADSGIDSVEKVKEGIKNYLSHIFSKDIDVLETIQNMLSRPNNGIRVETSQNTKATKTNKDDIAQANGKRVDKNDDPRKFEIYFKFQSYFNNIHSHQTLAINRGENLKFLSVKVTIPDRIQNEIYRIIEKKYFKNAGNPEYKAILSAALNDAYSKKLKPLISRQIRSTLTKNAEKDSIEVFAKNLKQLLLLRPVKGKRILGIDPGFKNGCKLALISEQNDVLETDCIYPHTRKDHLMIYEHKLINILKKYRCELIAIGNGTACRETESWIAGLIARNAFHSKSIQYCIVSENGASIYSCGPIAKKEFPDMDVNLISAVSIARRLSDPLAELVKIEPKHLGVGMYQHDISEKLLMESLNEVVTEVVSFVGVDINTASIVILKHIAGMNEQRAQNIIKHRSDNGPFKSRDDLKKVKSVGAKTFEQCAGFIRIDCTTANLNGKYNILDSTWVHPESYDLTKKIINKLKLSLNDVGTNAFISKIRETQQENGKIARLATEFRVPEERIKSIFEALGRELQKDYRDDADIQPLFKQGLLKMSDLKAGTIVTGAISNITTFGCFVDIGVEQNGLIHSSQMRGHCPNIGDRVNAYVISVDSAKGRIQLRLESII